MTALDPRVRSLVDAARAAEPSATDRARVRAALALRLGPNALPAARAPGAPSAQPPAPLATTTVAKLVVAGALIGAAGFAGGFLTGRAPTMLLARHGAGTFALAASLRLEQNVAMGPLPAAPAQDEPPAPADLATVASAHQVLPVSAPTALPVFAARARSPRIAPATAASSAPLPTVEPKASTLVEETDLLRRAQTSLGAGDAPAALAQLDDLAARHPDGQLREERLAARVAALCAMGHNDEARREAERLLAESPQSIHAGRVRGSCAFTPTRGR